MIVTFAVLSIEILRIFHMMWVINVWVQDKDASL